MTSFSSRTFWKVVAFVLLVALLFLSISLQDSRKKLLLEERKSSEILGLLIGESAIQGFSCGVLDKKLAEDFVGSKLSKKFGQGPADTNSETNISWQDSCRYEDPTNNSKYVELFINDYQSRQQAVSEFKGFFQTVNNNKQYPAADFGEELIYDSGVFYLRQNQRVIRVTASSGIPSESESFSYEVFTKLMTLIQ